MNHDERVRAIALDTAQRRLDETGKVHLADVAEAAEVSLPEIREQFPRPEDLLVGLLDRWLELVDEAVDAAIEVQDQSDGQLTRALLATVLSDDESLRTPWRRASVVAAVLTRPEVHARFDAWLARWARELEGDGVHPQRLTLVLLGAEALAVRELLGGDVPHDPEEIARVRSSFDALLSRPGAPLDAGA